VTADDTEESVCSLVEAKVTGYLLKDEDVDRYIEAIHDVAQGRPFFSRDSAFSWYFNNLEP
jgi:DNA-binding NarL/FixJ family response regulator